jgi:hypothetical protein
VTTRTILVAPPQGPLAVSGQEGARVDRVVAAEPRTVELAGLVFGRPFLSLPNALFECAVHFDTDVLHQLLNLVEGLGVSLRRLNGGSLRPEAYLP